MCKLQTCSNQKEEEDEVQLIDYGEYWRIDIDSPVMMMMMMMMMMMIMVMMLNN